MLSCDDINSEISYSGFHRNKRDYSSNIDMDLSSLSISHSQNDHSLSETINDNQFRDNQFRDNQFRDNQYRDNQYRDNQYRDNQFREYNGSDSNWYSDLVDSRSDCDRLSSYMYDSVGSEVSQSINNELGLSNLTLPLFDYYPNYNVESDKLDPGNPLKNINSFDTHRSDSINAQISLNSTVSSSFNGSVGNRVRNKRNDRFANKPGNFTNIDKNSHYTPDSHYSRGDSQFSRGDTHYSRGGSQYNTRLDSEFDTQMDKSHFSHVDTQYNTYADMECNTQINNSHFSHSDTHFTHSESSHSPEINSSIHMESHPQRNSIQMESQRQMNSMQMDSSQLSSSQLSSTQYYSPGPECTSPLEVSSLKETRKPFYQTKESPVFLKILATQLVSGTIIGRGGKGLNWFRRKSKVDDIVLSMPWELYPKTEYRTLLLKGSVKSVIKSTCIISELMNSSYSLHTDNTMLVMVVIPDLFLSAIDEIKRTTNPDSLSITLFRDENSRHEEIVAVIKGDKPRVKDLIVAIATSITETIPSEKYCFVTYHNSEHANTQPELTQSNSYTQSNSNSSHSSTHNFHNHNSPNNHYNNNQNNNSSNNNQPNSNNNSSNNNNVNGVYGNTSGCVSNGTGQCGKGQKYDEIDALMDQIESSLDKGNLGTLSNISALLRCKPELLSTQVEVQVNVPNGVPEDVFALSSIYKCDLVQTDRDGDKVQCRISGQFAGCFATLLFILTKAN
ncbi:hypothetical protein TpMuguga_04g00835 [Theileria parva strain Muguga]|uniref:K Homology domain-containing protein n=1 Tax=Theileria parva TaxID=5875 RepID=Q4N1B1_THEPA|nr:uncharacterized protein TpMuguga_04g00835 [Theileria parva strain Muguga]EAN32189.1 hypothetical protein TpMuguga_04g00835 [Theileria parva strain Muguga]|eukprot:XP_764472.1 hypothetical protein [Theileria parva strain Muguga]